MSQLIMNISANFHSTNILIRRFNLPFLSISPPWDHVSTATPTPTSMSIISSLLDSPNAATALTSGSTTDNYGIYSASYVTTTNNIVIPITGEYRALFNSSRAVKITNGANVFLRKLVQGPPEQTIYPIASEGFNYFTSSAPKDPTRLMIAFCIVFVFSVLQTNAAAGGVPA